MKVLSFDLDGTIFRKNLDDVLWNVKIPELFAEKKNISFSKAQHFVLDEYNKVGQSDIRWYLPEYWFNLFNLNTSLNTVLDSMDYSSGIYDDVSVIQEFAKNYMIVISTNNPRSILEYKLKVLKDIMNISHVFSSVSDFDNILKNRQFFTLVCSKLGIKPQYMLHIGDDPFYDVSEPCAAGINVILIDRDGKSSALHNFYDLRLVLNY